jgi:C-terminal processing protease CtpA/Prc
LIVANVDSNGPHFDIRSKGPNPAATIPTLTITTNAGKILAIAAMKSKIAVTMYHSYPVGHPFSETDGDTTDGNEHALPAGWAVASYTASGNPLYYNAYTHETSKDFPVEATPIKAPTVQQQDTTGLKAALAAQRAAAESGAHESAATRQHRMQMEEQAKLEAIKQARLAKSMADAAKAATKANPSVKAKKSYLTIVIQVDVPAGQGLGIGVLHEEAKKKKGPVNMVGGMAPGGNAERNGKIQVGDRFMKVNNTDVSAATREETIAALKAGTAAGTKVKLTMKRLAPPGAEPTPVAQAAASADNNNNTNISLTVVQPRQSKAAPPQDDAEDEDPDTADRDGPATVMVKLRVPNGEGIGIGVLHENGKNTVSGMAVGGNAEKNGQIQSGDRFLLVNSTDVSDTNRADTIAALKAGATAGEIVTILFERTPPKIPFELIVAREDGQKLGMGLVGPQGAEDPRKGVYISKIAEGGAASSNPAAKLGLRIVSVNGIDTTNSFKKQVSGLFKDAGSTVTIMVVNDGGSTQFNVKPPEDETPPPKPPKSSKKTKTANGQFTVSVLVPTGQGLGVGVRHDDDTNRNFVSGLAVGGNAEKVGQIKANDRFMRVNSTDVSATSRADTIAALKAAAAAGEIITIMFERSAPTVTGQFTTSVPVPIGQGLGIGVRHDDATNQNFVKGLAVGGNAEKVGQIEVNDQFMRVNSTDVSVTSRADLIASLKAAAAAGDVVRITFQRGAVAAEAEANNFYDAGVPVPASSTTMMPDAPPPIPPKVLEVAPDPLGSEDDEEEMADLDDVADSSPISLLITRQAEGQKLGLGLVGPADENDARKGVYISKVTPGGAASGNPEIKLGLRILQVNGVDVTDAMKTQVTGMMKAAGERVEMVVVNDQGEGQYNIKTPKVLAGADPYEGVGRLALLQMARSRSLKVPKGITKDRDAIVLLLQDQDENPSVKVKGNHATAAKKAAEEQAAADAKLAAAQKVVDDAVAAEKEAAAAAQKVIDDAVAAEKEAAAAAQKVITDAATAEKKAAAAAQKVITDAATAEKKAAAAAQKAIDDAAAVEKAKVAAAVAADAAVAQQLDDDAAAVTAAAAAVQKAADDAATDSLAAKIGGFPTWFHGKIGKDKAGELVTRAGGKNGTFLVWERKPPREYGLTVVYNNKPSHHLIKLPDGSDIWTINKTPFGNQSNMFKMIEVLAESTVKGWPVQLTPAVHVPPDGLRPEFPPAGSPLSELLSPVAEKEAADARAASAPPPPKAERKKKKSATADDAEIVVAAAAAAAAASAAAAAQGMDLDGLIAASQAAAASSVVERRSVTLHTNATTVIGMKLVAQTPTGGVVVSSVDPNSLASNAGTAAGDIIVEINGKNIQHTKPRLVGAMLMSSDNLTFTLESTPSARTVTIVEGNAATMGVKFQPHPTASGGVVVKTVESDGPAAEKLSIGDHITHVNGVDVASASMLEFGTQLKASTSTIAFTLGDSVVLPPAPEPSFDLDDLLSDASGSDPRPRAETFDLDAAIAQAPDDGRPRAETFDLDAAVAAAAPAEPTLVMYDEDEYDGRTVAGRMKALPAGVPSTAFEVVITRPASGKIGLTFASDATNGCFVTGIKADSASAGLHPEFVRGVRICAINDVSTMGSDKKGVSAKLAAAGGVVRLYVAPDTAGLVAWEASEAKKAAKKAAKAAKAAAEAVAAEVVGKYTVVLEKPAGTKLGMTFVGPTSDYDAREGCYVSKVTPDSLVNTSDAKIQRGTRIMEINGNDCVNVMKTDVSRLLKTTVGTLTFVFDNSYIKTGFLQYDKDDAANAAAATPPRPVSFSEPAPVSAAAPAATTPVATNPFGVPAPPAESAEILAARAAAEKMMNDMDAMMGKAPSPPKPAPTPATNPFAIQTPEPAEPTLVMYDEDEYDGRTVAGRMKAVPPASAQDDAKPASTPATNPFANPTPEPAEPTLVMYDEDEYDGRTVAGRMKTVQPASAQDDAVGNPLYASTNQSTDDSVADKYTKMNRLELIRLCKARDITPTPDQKKEPDTLKEMLRAADVEEAQMKDMEAMLGGGAATAAESRSAAPPPPAPYVAVAAVESRPAAPPPPHSNHNFYADSGKLVLKGMCKTRGLDVPASIRDADGFKGLLESADQELGSSIGDIKWLQTYLKKSVASLRAMCTGRGIPIPADEAALSWTELVKLLIENYEAVMFAEFGDANAGEKYLQRLNPDPDPKEAAHECTFTKAGEKHLLRYARECTTCPNLKCKAPNLVFEKLEDRDYRKQFFTPQWQCKKCAKLFYKALSLEDICRQRGLVVPPTGTATWVGTNLIRLDRELGKPYASQSESSLKSLCQTRGYDITGKVGTAALADVLVEQDLIKLAEKVWERNVSTIAKQVAPFVGVRAMGVSFPDLDAGVALEPSALYDLIQVERPLTTDAALVGKYERKKYRLADDEDTKWVGTKGADGIRMASLSVLLPVYGLPIPPKEFGNERSHALAVSGIVHLQATLNAAFSEADLINQAEKYAMYEANELKIMCKKRRIDLTTGNGKNDCLMELAKADNMIYWATKADSFRRLQESDRDAVQCATKGAKCAASLATRGPDDAVVWKVWGTEKDLGCSTSEEDPSPSMGGGDGSSGGSGGGGGGYADPCTPPLGLPAAPGWLHGEDMKQAAAKELVKKQNFGAFLVRLKKAGSGFAYSLVVNIGKEAKETVVAVDSAGLISLDAKFGQLSGRLVPATKELKTLAELIDYLSNTKFTESGRWKLGLTCGIEKDGSAMPSGWTASSAVDSGGGGGGGGGGDEGDPTTQLLNMLTKAPPKVHSAAGKSHVHSAVKFKVICDGPCCDLNTGYLRGEKWECKLAPARKPKVRFGTTADLEKTEEVKEYEEMVAAMGNVPGAVKAKCGYSVHFRALKDYIGQGNGYMKFQRNENVYVWNETGDDNADLGKVGPDGVYWMYGFNDDESSVGLFPADHVAAGNPDSSLDHKLG